MSYALTVATQVLVLFAMIAAGFVLTKVGLLTAKGARQIADILFYLITPCVIIEALATTALSADSVRLLLTGGAACLISFAIGIPLSLPLFRRQPPDSRPVLRFGMAFSNCGYMSLPLANALCGREGVLVVSAFVVVFNMVAFTYGVSTFETAGVNLRRALLNPGLIGVLIGLPVFLLKGLMPEALTLPQTFLSGFSPAHVVRQPISMLAAVNAPMAMLITGCYLAGSHLKIGRGDRAMLLGIAMRLVAIPTLVITVFYLLGLRGPVFIAAMIPVCAPCGTNTVMFAAKYNKDAPMAARMVPLSTLLSVATLPVMLAVVSLL